MSGLIAIPLPSPAAVQVRPRAGESPRPGDEFLVGPENQIVAAAVQAVLEEGSTRYNPLVFCGPSGTGKTHLATGLAAVWAERYGRRARVACVAAADFAREVREAIDALATDELREKYRKAALLVFEDLDHLAAKPAAQEELLHTFEALVAAGGRLIVTCRTAPCELPDFSIGLATRLMAGLVVPLVPPSEEVRTELVMRLAAAQQCQMTHEIARVLARGLPVTAPELAGALTQLAAMTQLAEHPLDEESARQVVAERGRQRRPSLAEITSAVARHFDLRLGELRGPSRRQRVARARHAVVYLAHELLGVGFVEIGQHLGSRDRTTVAHGYEKGKQLAREDSAFSESLARLRRQLRLNEGG